MRNWHGWDGEEGPDSTKLAFAIGAGLGLLVLGWMLFARAEDDKVSSSGFSDGGAGVASSPFSSQRRAQAGPAFAGRSPEAAPSASAPLSGALSSVRPEALPGAAASVAGSAAATTAAAAGNPPPDPKEMAAAGMPTDAAGLQKLGSDSGLLTGAISRLLDHPRILRALMDNKLVVDALMDRDDSKRNCSDTGALQAGLSSPGAGAYESKMAPLVSAALARPDAVAALAGSEMGSRLMACPSLQGLAHNPAGLMAIAVANPQVVSMASDPRVAQALSSSIQGATLLGGVRSSLSGGTSGSGSN
jgi:hypothetical protein